MAYSAQNDVAIAAGGLERLAELTDIEGTGLGTVNTAVLDAAIVDADAEINSYVGRNNAVPLAVVPAVVRRISADEAVYFLRARRQLVGESDQMRHDQNVRWLEQVARGAVTLGVEPHPDKSSLVQPVVVVVDDEDTEITAANTKGFW